MVLQFYNNDQTAKFSNSTQFFSKIAKKNENPDIYSDFGKNLILYEKGQLVDPEETKSFIASESDIIAHKDMQWFLYKESYKRVPIVYNAVNNTADFAVEAGFDIEGSDSAKTTINKWFDRVNFEQILRNIFIQMQVYGNAYLEITDINNPKLLPPDTMFVRVRKPEGTPLLGYTQKVGVKEQTNPTWEPEQIIHFKWNTAINPFYGMSEIHPALGAIQRYENWMIDLGQILHNFAAPIIHYRIGTPEAPASQTQIDNFRSELENRLVGDDLITSGAIESTVVGDGKLKLFQPDSMVNDLENGVIAAMRIPATFARGGESSNKATAKEEIGAFEKKVKALQGSVSDLLEDMLFPKITNRSSDNKMVWNEFSAEGELIRAQRIKFYTEAGIPADIALKMAGLGSWSDEVKKAIEEQQKKDMETQKELIKAQPQGPATKTKPARKEV